MKFIKTLTTIKATAVAQILAYFKKNPIWVSAFTTGEGCFTASFQVSNVYTWGFSFQIEFNIAQSMTDKDLLDAINQFFNNVGGVYPRKNGVGTFSVRDQQALKNTIVPYFMSYPVLGAKQLDFEKWKQILELLATKKHVGSSMEARDANVAILLLIRDLNSRNARNSAKKLARNIIITDWLLSLKSVPTKEQRTDFLANLAKRTANVQNENNDEGF